MATETRSLKRRNRPKRAFALIFVLAFAAIIVVFTAAAGAQANFNLRLASNRGQTDRAYYAANTGTQLILSLMREPPADRDFDGDGAIGTWLGEDCSVALTMLSTNANCFSRVYHNIQGFGNAQAVAPNDVPIPEDCFYIVSVGVVAGQYDADGNLVGGYRQDQATMGATLAPTFPLMPHAAFALENLVIEGDVNHFNSTVGPAPWTPSADRSLPEASVGTNSQDHLDISVTGAGRVNGNVLLGHGTPSGELTALSGTLGTPAPVVAAAGARVNTFGEFGTQPPGNASNAVVSGRVDSLPAPKTLPDMNIDPTRIEANFVGDVSSGVTRTLEEGKIYLQEGDLNVTGGTIEVHDTNDDGEVEDSILLVEGNIRFTSGQINHEMPPRRLKIYSNGPTGSTFTMDGTNFEAFCLVAGRHLSATIQGNNTLWGAVLADTVALQPNSTVNFDVNLRDPNLMPGIYGFTLGTTTILPGAGVSPALLGPVGGGTGTGTSGTGTSGTGTSGTGTSGTTTGGCGCGCGGGSMLAAVRKV